jgi:hypothetical protein
MQDTSRNVLHLLNLLLLLLLHAGPGQIPASAVLQVQQAQARQQHGVEG